MSQNDNLQGKNILLKKYLLEYILIASKSKTESYLNHNTIIIEYCQHDYFNWKWYYNKVKPIKITQSHYFTNTIISITKNNIWIVSYNKRKSTIIQKLSNCFIFMQYSCCIIEFVD